MKGISIKYHLSVSNEKASDTNEMSIAEEGLIVKPLGAVRDWRFPLTKVDIRGVVEKFM